MKTAIIYISRHGTTTRVAQNIAQQIEDKETELIDLKENKNVDLSSFSRVLLGGSIHMGQIHKKTKSFIEKHRAELLNKELGLFLCCMETGEKAKEQYDMAFPEELRIHAKSNAIMGYEYLLEKMGFLEKLMLKKITGKDKSFSMIDNKAITDFAEHFHN